MAEVYLTSKTELLKVSCQNAMPIAALLGFSLDFDEEGRATIRLPFDQKLTHGAGAISGPVISALLDYACVYTSAAGRPDNQIVITSNLTVHFLRPAVGQALYAKGEIIRSGRMQDVVSSQVWDTSERLIAHAVGTFVAVEKGQSGSI